MERADLFCNRVLRHRTLLPVRACPPGAFCRSIRTGGLPTTAAPPALLWRGVRWLSSPDRTDPALSLAPSGS